MSRAAHQASGVIELDHHGGDLQQGVALAVETAGLDVHHHGQEAAKAARHAARALLIVHGRSPQAMRSLARRGTSSPLPKG
jgi:hypothetical protein